MHRLRTTSFGMAIAVATSILIPLQSASANSVATIQPSTTCLTANDASISAQYQARPIPGKSLTDVLAYFHQNSPCNQPTVAMDAVGGTPISPNLKVRRAAVMSLTTAGRDLCIGGCGLNESAGLHYQGTWEHNGSVAIGQNTECGATYTFPTFSVTDTECDWVYAGGTGYLNSYALMRYRFTVTQTLLWITSSNYYWYWLNAYTDGTHLFGCREC